MARYKRRRANPTQSKSESDPEGVESHADVLSQPLPKPELSILLLTGISSRQVVIDEIPAWKNGSKIFLDLLLGSLNSFSLFLAA